MVPCCEAMKAQLEYKCDLHPGHCPDQVIRTPEEGRYLLAAENASYDFEFCPWCGVRVQEPDGDAELCVERPQSRAHELPGEHGLAWRVLTSGEFVCAACKAPWPDGPLSLEFTRKHSNRACASDSR